MTKIKRIILIGLIVISPVMLNAAGLQIGMTGAVKSKVKALDKKVQAKKAKINALSVTGQLNPPNTKYVQGMITLPVGSPLQVSSLSIVSILSESPISGNNAFSLNVINQQQGQIVFVTNQNGDVIMPAYVPSNAVLTNNAQINSTQAALGMILLNPYLMVLPKNNREQIIQDAQQNLLFAQLVGEIEVALVQEPQNLMNYSVFPQIFKDSLTIGINVLKSYGVNIAHSPSAKHQAIMSAAIVGNNNDPHLEDVSGSDINFVNPKMIFYGVEVTNNSGQEIKTELVEGKESLESVQFGWPPVYQTPAVTDEYNLGDGTFNIRFYKGLNWTEPNWLSFKSANGKATWANFLKPVCLALDALAYCPLNNGDIKALVSLPDEPNIPGMELLSRHIQDEFDPLQLLSNIVEKAHDNWPEITKWIWKQWPGITSISYLSLTKNMLDKLFIAMPAIDVANTDIPLVYDLVTAPGNLGYSIQQTNGVLYEVSKTIPPTAVINVSTASPVVDETVTFDASQSFDDHDASNALRVRWDFNGDNVPDTTWSTNKTATYVYSNSGTNKIKLEVMDTDGLIGTAAFYLNVRNNQAQGSSMHIKLFRDSLPWDSNAFETMMQTLNITANSQPRQYEILSSADMSTNILQPAVDLVIISNDQNQNFYNNLAANYSRFERFARNGGTILWEACDNGWAEGSMQTAGLTLPGGVTYSFNPDEYNNILDTTTAPLTRGLPNPITGDFASHEDFSNLPAGTIIYATDVTYNSPTLVEYRYGSGWIVLTANPLEWGYDRLDTYTMGQLYPRIIEYALGMPINFSAQSSPKIALDSGLHKARKDRFPTSRGR